MRLDRTLTDIRRAVERILIAFDRNITVQENFGPSGAPAGHVLTSVGVDKVPVWQAAAATAGTPGPQGPRGEAGPAGANGANGTPIDVTSQFNKIMTADFGSGTELMFDHLGNVMYIE